MRKLFSRVAIGLIWLSCIAAFFILSDFYDDFVVFLAVATIALLLTSKIKRALKI